MSETKKRNIEVEVVASSENPDGGRITTMLWTYPRFIHAEIMTHRMLSRNAASSRAIPVKKVIEAIRENPAMPEWWGASQKGMQADEQLPDHSISHCQAHWFDHREEAIRTAECLLNNGLHKQIANRVLEPWFHITVLVTATEWENFFALRAHPAAQPEFQVLAYRALDAYLKATPAWKDWGDWHIPFDPDPDETIGMSIEDRLTVSVAKSARTSYVAFDADKTLEEQKALFDTMKNSGHWSPFEHQAQADNLAQVSGNFRWGWRQYRTDFPGENREADLRELLANKPDWIEL